MVANGDEGAVYIPLGNRSYIEWSFNGGAQTTTSYLYEINGSGNISNPPNPQPFDIRYDQGFNASYPNGCIGHKLVLYIHDIGHLKQIRAEFEIINVENSPINDVSSFSCRLLGYNTWNDGTQGVQGTRGYQGYQGYQGLQGTRGIQGRRGYQGYQGRSFSTSLVHNVTSTDPANWFIPDVSDYFISSNDTGNVFLNKNYLALNSEIHNLSWEQINFTLSGIYDPKVTDVSGFLDDLEKNYMYKIYVENDIYTMLNSTCILKVKLIRSPEAIAIIECYVDRSVAKI